MTRPQPKKEETPTAKGLKRVRVRLTYVMRVADDFPIYQMGQNINRLIARGVLVFTRDDDEVIQTEGGARLQMSVLGEPRGADQRNLLRSK